MRVSSVNAKTLSENCVAMETTPAAICSKNGCRRSVLLVLLRKSQNLKIKDKIYLKYLKNRSR